MSFLEFEENDTEVLKCILFLERKYLVIGKSNGFISLYDIIDNKHILTDKISNGSITYLLNYKTKDTDFILCCDEPKVFFFKLVLKNNKYNLKKFFVKNKIHESGIKKIEFLGNNNFATCSKDSTFKIWSLEEIKITLKENAGLENFFINFKNKTLLTLNKKSILSFYIYKKKYLIDNLLLKEIISNIDYTNSNSIKKIKDKLYIGGYKYFQIINIKTMQMITKVKIGYPISFIFNPVNEINNNFIILGLKNGKLEFRSKTKFNKLDKSKIIELEKDNKYFKFSNLFIDEDIILFENQPIIVFDLIVEKLICISDNNIRFYNKSKIENKKEIKSNGLFSSIFNKVNFSFYYNKICDKVIEGITEINANDFNQNIYYY